MTDLVPISVVAKYEGVSNNTILQKIYRNKDIASHLSDSNNKGRGGKVRLININSSIISDAAREKYYLSQPMSPSAEEIKAPASFQLGPSVTTPVSGKEGHSLPSPSAKDAISEKFKTIALARFDLLAAWKDHRRVYGKPKGLIRADEDFEKAYNTGLLLSSVYKVLGNIDMRTIKRWLLKLDNTQDWMCLVPEWTCERKEPALSIEEKKIFQDCLLQPNRLNIGEATKITKTVLAKRGIESLSSQRKFRRWAEWYKGKNSHIWTLMREGQKALKDKEIFSIKRDVSKLEVGDVLIADGHRLNFQVVNPFTGKPCRATLIGYLDWKSWDLAGYDIMLEENTQSIASALRNGIIRLGKIPKISYQDNGKAFRAKFFINSVDFEEAGFYGLFGRLGIKPVFAMSYNARAKLIERFFKEFAKFERLLPSFTGTSIEDKPAYLKRNETFHKTHHNGHIPTIGEAIGMVDAWIREYLEMQPCPHVKGKTIGEVFREGQGPGVNVADLDELMMAQEIKTIHANGIRFLGADYFDEGLCGLREKVIIKYSLSDLSSIKVYDREGAFVGAANRVMPVHPMARHLGDVKDVTEYRYQQSRQKKLEKITMNAARELIAQGEETPPQLDIIGTISMTPNMIKKLEEEETSFCQRKEERSFLNNILSNETVLVSEVIKSGAEETSGCEDLIVLEDVPATYPIFKNESERYEWCIKQGSLTDEDVQWIAEFKKGPIYENGYRFFEKQEEEQRRNETLYSACAGE